MTNSAIFVVLICTLMSSLIEANSNYDGKFESCYNFNYMTVECKLWNASAVVRIVKGPSQHFTLLFNTEDHPQELRKLNLTEGAYSNFLPIIQVVMTDVNMDGASGPFINQRHLQYVQLFNNSLQEFPRDFFRGIPNLRQLEIYYQNFSTLSNHHLSEISENLEFLSLTRSSVKNIEAEAFSKFHQLTYLNLSYNSLTELKPCMFNGLDSLVNLHLQGNKITTIRPGTFVTVLNLSALSLDGNPLDSLPQKIFTYLENLEFVTFSGNQNENTCKALLKGLNRLTYGFCGSIAITGPYKEVACDCRC
ncbi:leucine-rich repeat-containing protein 15-like [Fopius arisanus]|uniref:Leucine-rich repeat-containing protein 15-like n=1 Tax=Fopius arisanus TaxID=64838 RepID=A0A9R1TS94_9HYME|nr:PREDICTED: leucine-rich repeat-containing protein 15-like [Fopius arisanus]